MEIQLTDPEADELRNLLVGSLSDLRMEIADTENPAYRRGLQERREILEAVLARLKA
jgi:hypothetical protein